MAQHRDFTAVAIPAVVKQQRALRRRVRRNCWLLLAIPFELAELIRLSEEEWAWRSAESVFVIQFLTAVSHEVACLYRIQSPKPGVYEPRREWWVTESLLPWVQFSIPRAASFRIFSDRYGEGEMDYEEWKRWIKALRSLRKARRMQVSPQRTAGS